MIVRRLGDHFGVESRKKESLGDQGGCEEDGRGKPGGGEKGIFTHQSIGGCHREKHIGLVFWEGALITEAEL